MRRYNPQQLEPKWQKVWRDSDLYKVDMSRTADKYYIIPMLPYPSGDLHVGHWYNFAPTDTLARFNRMLGRNVLSTIGFDSFGLPAENAAIKRGIQPAQWTYSNIKTMMAQIDQIGASYDWSHTLTTSDPEYYRWNQWLFLQLYKHKLAYRAKSLVNWCPKDQTVLANEQVVGEKNVCERCGTPVVQKDMEQWFFKITDYADRLLDDLEQVDWPTKVKTMQANWIGKSQGALIKFKVKDSDTSIEVFTTRPDTLFGATYMVLAPEHPLVKQLATSEQKSKVADYVRETERKTELERKEGEKDKTGVFTGAYAINPANKEELPVWIADFVLAQYGSGAVFADACDERDFEFAKKFGIPLKPTVIPEDEIEAQKVKDLEYAYTGEGVLINSGKYDGMSTSEAREKIVADLAKDKIAKEQTNYKLRDWLISRQRYWGTPIPIVYCDDCSIVPVPESQLPVALPEDVTFELNSRSPLAAREDFVNTKCPNCKKPAKRETDTMDTFVCSSWYFLRYLDNHNNRAPFDNAIINKWAPLDHYIGGIEHAILHLLYARFVTKFLHDHHGLDFDEPFKKLTNQGLILGPDGQKMSKSRGNVVSPDEQVTSYGADSLRLYLMFMGPYEQGGPYSMGGIAGTRRFLERVWTLVNEFADAKQVAMADTEAVEIAVATHKTIKKVTKDLETLGFNTAIATLMSFVNELYKIKVKQGLSRTWSWKQSLETLVQLLAPFAPHISEELWAELGHENSVHISSWPLWDENLVKEEMLTLAVQVNGKVRAEIVVEADITEHAAIEAAKSDERIVKLIAGKHVKKTIYVPGRLVSLVT
ncbi:leucine--tRNA ligase [Candidatus Saccharibacteria bacterium CG10_big_fil_rev_8_21_14_0_10_47_8]|nr:MAG: leucine--tRNA ligase [Candidatus Saccharibacteria bacterium CG10_big_fil_rev_8_21_14_0_10_47_8]